MVTWVTVWILTVASLDGHAGKNAYQLQYATKDICEKQKNHHKNQHNKVRCDFQQIPLVKQ